jgi:pimeloyl-ACP methyl ester carboxylesterase
VTADGVVVEVQWHELASGRVRVRNHRPAGRAPVGHVALLPGLALPSYLVPLAHRLAQAGVEASVLDTLAFRGGRRADPSVTGLAAVAAQWVVAGGQPGSVVVLGHSTGAQVAAEVALSPVTAGRVAALVLAGPTFTPAQRSLPRAALAACTAYRRDTPRELVVVRDAVRVRGDVVRIIRSALTHRLEDRLPHLTMPVTLMAGEADSFAPRAWLDVLAGRAGGPSRCVVLPGSHNSVFPYAAQTARLVRTVVDEVA